MKIENATEIENTYEGGARVFHQGQVIGTIQVRPIRNQRGDIFGRDVNIYLAPDYRTWASLITLEKRLKYQAKLVNDNSDFGNQTRINWPVITFGRSVILT